MPVTAGMEEVRFEGLRFYFSPDRKTTHTVNFEELMPEEADFLGRCRSLRFLAEVLIMAEQ